MKALLACAFTSAVSTASSPAQRPAHLSIPGYAPSTAEVVSVDWLHVIDEVWPGMHAAREVGHSLELLTERGRTGATRSQGHGPDIQVTPTIEDIEENRPSVPEVASTTLVYCVMATLIAFLYIEYRRPPSFVSQQNSDAEFSEWRHGFFTCFEDLNICCCAWCCPCIRWAETLHYVPGLLRFWDAFFFALAFWFILQVMLGAATNPFIFIAFYTVFSLLGAFFRQRLRKTFNFREDTSKMFVFDFLLFFCGCSCCAIAQDARQVEEAVKFSRCLDRKPVLVGEGVATRRFEPPTFQAAALQPRYIHPSTSVPYQAPPNIPDSQQEQGPPSTRVPSAPPSVSVPYQAPPNMPDSQQEQGPPSTRVPSAPPSVSVPYQAPQAYGTATSLPRTAFALNAGVPRTSLPTTGISHGIAPNRNIYAAPPTSPSPVFRNNSFGAAQVNAAQRFG